MATREPQRQGEHDAVVSWSRSRWVEQTGGKYDIYENPDGHKNKGVQGKDGVHYPDVVFITKGSGLAEFIEEVETEDSVNNDEARQQWVPYSRLGCKGFGIVVPKGRGPAAERIGTDNGVTFGWIHEYRVENGKVVFQKYK